MADLSEKELKNAFLKALQDYDAATNTGGGGGGGGGGTAEEDKKTESTKKSTAGAERAAEALGGFTGKIVEGGARFKDATGALEKGFSLVGGETGKLSGLFAASAAGLNKLGVNIDQSVDTFRKMSDSGLTFGNDIVQMKLQSSAARMSIAEMTEVLGKNNTNLVGLGMTAGDSAKKFSQVSDQFFTSGLGEGLRAMGYTTKELNDVMAVSVSAQKIGLATGKVTEKEAAESAARLATEMDAVAKLTGKSKQEQLDDLKRKQEDGQLRAATELAVRQGGEKVRGAFQEMSTASAIGGKDFQKLQEQMFAMGRPSQDMAAKFAMAGGEVQSLMKQAADAAKSGKEGSAAEAKRLTEQAAMAYAARQNSDAMLQLAAQGEENAVQMNANSRQLTDNLDAVAKANKLDLTKTEDRIKAKEILDKRVEQDQKGLDKDGKEAPTKAITEFAINVESRGRDLTKALSEQLIKPLAERTGPKLKEFNDQLLGLNGLKGITLAADKAERQGIINQAPKTIEQEKKDQGITKADKNYADVEKLEKLLSGSTTKDAAADALKKIAAKEEKKPEDLIANAMKDKGAGAADLGKKLQDALPEGIKKLQSYEERTGKTAPPEAVRTVNREAGVEPVGVPGLLRSGVDTAADGIAGLLGLFTQGTAKVRVENLPPTLTPAAPTPTPVAPAPAPAPVAPAAEAPVPRRQAGSLEMAGKMFEDFGKGTMVELHGLESVMRPQDLGKVVEAAMGGVRKTMPKIDMSSTDNTAPKLDLSSISKSISTSISSVSGGKESNVKLSADDIADMQKPFKKSFTEISDGFDDLISDSSNIVKENSEKIKADISDALPVKEMAAKQEEFKSQFTESQQKIIDDYKGYSEENRSFHAQAMEAGIKEDTETAQMIGARISKMKADIGDRQATEEEQAALENQEANKKMFEEQVDKKKEMLDIMQNLGDYSAKRELELKKKSADTAIAIEDKKAEAIKADISSALPVDTNFGDLDGAIAKNKADDEIAALEKQTAILQMKAAGIDVEAMEAKNKEEDDFRAAKAAFDSAVPEKLNLAGSPKVDQSKAPNLDSISFGPNGMPMFKQLDSAKQSLSKEPQATSKKTETGAAAKPASEEKETKTASAAKNDATLNDVVKSLDMLNKQMGQLLSQHAEIGNKQVRATKSNSANLYT